MNVIAPLKTTQHVGSAKVRALFEQTYFAGLRKAGMGKTDRHLFFHPLSRRRGMVVRRRGSRGRPALLTAAVCSESSPFGESVGWC